MEENRNIQTQSQSPNTIAEYDKDMAKRYYDLPLYYRVAIDFKYQGYEASQILHEVQKLKPGVTSEKTIYMWFYKGGLLYPYYEWRKQMFNSASAEVLEQVDRMLKEAGPLAVQTLIASMKKYGSWKAAVEVLNRIGFNDKVAGADKKADLLPQQVNIFINEPITNNHTTVVDGTATESTESEVVELPVQADDEAAISVEIPN